MEETAGTSMYNNMKKQSMKLIIKKESKVAEMTNLLENEIKPQMEKLKIEREKFFVWKTC